MINIFYNKNSVRGVFSLVIRYLLALIFLISGVSKLLPNSSFSDSLTQFMTPNIVPLIAIIIPLYELLIAVMLISGYKSKVFLIIYFYTIILFTGVISVNLLLGNNDDCGCFGALIDNSQIGITTLVRNLILLLLALIAIYLSDNKKTKNDSILKDLINTITYHGIYLLFLLISIMSFIMTQQNIILKTKLQQLINTKNGLQVDQKITTLKVINTMNESTVLDFNNTSKTTLLYIFSTHCEPCKINFNTWINLTDSLNTKDINIIGLCPDSISTLKVFLSGKKVNFKVFSAIIDVRFKNEYRGNITPQTVLLDRFGVVKKNWVGVLTPYDIYSLVKRIN